MHRVTLGIALALLSCYSNQCCAAEPTQSLVSKLDRRVKSFSLSETSLPRALIVLASQFEIPMGIEWKEPESVRSIEIQREDASIREILKGIVEEQVGYQIAFGPEMVEVSYIGSREDASNFLNIKLDRFWIENRYVGLALRDLHDRVHARMTNSPLRTDRVGHTMLEPDDIRITKDFKNATVRDIINYLTLRSGHQVWAVSFRKPPAQTAGGFHRTFTLWNDAAIPDYAQPVWDRFLWGKALPAK